MAHFVWRRWRVEHKEESLVTPAAEACYTKPHPISFTFSLLGLKAALHLPSSLLSKLVLFKPKKDVLERRYNYYVLQRGHGNNEDSEDSQSSQGADSSQPSQETDSSQDVTEHLIPWSCMLDEAQERHEVQLNDLVDEYKRNGDSEIKMLLTLKGRTLPLLSTEKNWEKYC